MTFNYNSPFISPGVIAFPIIAFPNKPSNPQMPTGGVSLMGGYSTSTGIIGTSQDSVVPYRRATGADGNLAGPNVG